MPARINIIQITNVDIVCTLKSLHPGKSNGPDEISTKMSMLCSDTVIIPLKIIYENILSTGIFPDVHGNKRM